MSFNHTCLLLAMEMASKHTRTVENNFGNPKKRLHENDPPRKTTKENITDVEIVKIRKRNKNEN